MVVKGVVRGCTIWLEQPVPEFEGLPVVAEIMRLGEAAASPTETELRQAWDAWLARGPDGPLDDEEPRAADWP